RVGQTVRVCASYFGGPWLVRGFAPNGFGPRDLTVGTTRDNVGGKNFWGASLELQSPIPNLPKDIGLKFATFADVGSVWNYGGPQGFSPPNFPDTPFRHGRDPRHLRRPPHSSQPRPPVVH